MLDVVAAERLSTQLAEYFRKHPPLLIADLKWRIDAVTGAEFKDEELEVLEQLVRSKLGQV